MSKDETVYYSETHLDEDGNLYVILPDEIMNQMGWATGDTLEWLDVKDGSVTIVKKEEQNE